MEESTNENIFSDLKRFVDEEDEEDEDDDDDDSYNNLLIDCPETEMEYDDDDDDDDDFDELENIIEKNILKKRIAELEDPLKNVQSSCDPEEESLLEIMGFDKKEIPDVQCDQAIHLIQSAIEQNRKLKSILEKLEGALIVKLRHIDLISDEESNAHEESTKLWEGDFYTRFASPYFRDGNFPCPQNNEQLMKEKLNYSLYRYGNIQFSWDVGSMKNLEDAILDLLVTDYMEKNNSDSPQTAFEKQSVVNKIQHLRNSSLVTILDKLGIDGLDWDSVACKMGDGYASHDCEALWNVYLKPSINKKSWSVAENRSLGRIAESNDYRDWDSIAEKLNTNRTGYLCFMQYLRKVEKPPVKWTKEEFSLLEKIIQVSKEGEHVNWSKILYYCDEHSFNHLYYKYYKTFNSTGELPKKGKFDLNEDKFIMHAVKNEGLSFNEVSKLMPSRNTSQIRERYYYLKQNDRKVGGWTLEEDMQLVKLVEHYGTGNWAKVAKGMKDRTRIQVRQHYEHIQKRLLKNPNLTLETYRIRKSSPMIAPKKRSRKIVDSTKCLEAFKKDKEEIDLLKYFAHERKVLEMRQSISSTFESNKEGILTLWKMLGITLKEDISKISMENKPWQEYIHEAAKFVHKQKTNLSSTNLGEGLEMTLLPPNLISFNVLRNMIIRLQEDKNYFAKFGGLEIPKEDSLFNTAVENWYKRLLIIFCTSLCIKDLTLSQFKNLKKEGENEK